MPLNLEILWLDVNIYLSIYLSILYPSLHIYIYIYIYIYINSFIIVITIRQPGAGATARVRHVPVHGRQGDPSGWGNKYSHKCICIYMYIYIYIYIYLSIFIFIFIYIYIYIRGTNIRGFITITPYEAPYIVVVYISQLIMINLCNFYRT